jgi:hypothetical protein
MVVLSITPNCSARLPAKACSIRFETVFDSVQPLSLAMRTTSDFNAGLTRRQSEGSGVFPIRGVSGGYPPQRRVRFVNDAGSYSHGDSNPPPLWRSQAVSCLRISARADIYLALPPCEFFLQKSFFFFRLFGCSSKHIIYFLYSILMRNL